MIKWELTLSPEPVTIIAELQQWVQDAWDNLSQDDIQHLYNCLHARIHTSIATKQCVCIVWAPLIVTFVLHLV